MKLPAALALVGSILCGCSSTTETPPLAVDSEETDGPPRKFAYTTLEGKLVSSKIYRGRMSVIVLFTTFDLACQAQARFLNAVYARHTPRINALLLVLEPPEHQVMVETFVESFDLRYDIAMADAETIAGRGPFPGLHHVPSTLLLDREGREVWRSLGLVEEQALHEAITSHE